MILCFNEVLHGWRQTLVWQGSTCNGSQHGGSPSQAFRPCMRLPAPCSCPLCPGPWADAHPTSKGPLATFCTFSSMETCGETFIHVGGVGVLPMCCRGGTCTSTWRSTPFPSCCRRLMVASLVTEVPYEKGREKTAQRSPTGKVFPPGQKRKG